MPPKNIYRSRKVVSCKYCFYEKNDECQLRVCPYVAERITAKVINYEKLILEPGPYNNCIGIPWDRRHAVALVDFAWLRCEKDPGVELRRHLKSFLLRDKALDIDARYINTERGPFNYMVVPRIVLDRPQSCHLAILLMMNASRMIAFGSLEGVWEPLMYCIENIQGGENLSFISECDFSIRFPYDTEKLNPLGTQTE